MTTIKSTTSGKEVEVFNGGLPESTVLCINDARGKIMGDILVPRADLLAALGAVDKDKALRQLDAEREHCEEYQTKLEEAEATIERVRALRDGLQLKSMEGKTVIRDAGIMQGIVERIDAALTSPMPFQLPTEAGITFTAKNGIGEEVTFCSVWNITPDGPAVLYVNSRDYLYNGDDVLKIFTDHRLLDGDS